MARMEVRLSGESRRIEENYGKRLDIIKRRFWDVLKGLISIDEPTKA